MVDFGSGQGRRAFGTAGVVKPRRGFQKRENAGLGRKMPFMDGHYLRGLSYYRRSNPEPLTSFRGPAYRTLRMRVPDLVLTYFQK